MALSYDIVLDEAAFDAASIEMEKLAVRTQILRNKLLAMYEKLVTALDTPAGKQLEITAKDVLIQPIDDLLIVIGHVSKTLNEIIGSGYYKDVFVQYEELNQSIKFN